jgi:hypothetical protein
MDNRPSISMYTDVDTINLFFMVELCHEPALCAMNTLTIGFLCFYIQITWSAE